MSVNRSEAAAAQDPRVRFAAERTLLAWIRTGLAMMGFGFVVARFGWFLHELSGREHQSSAASGPSLLLGVVMLSMGVLVNLLAAVGHLRLIRQLHRGETYRPPPWSMGITLALILAALGVAMAVYLIRLGNTTP